MNQLNRYSAPERQNEQCYRDGGDLEKDACKLSILYYIFHHGLFSACNTGLVSEFKSDQNVRINQLQSSLILSFIINGLSPR